MWEKIKKFLKEKVWEPVEDFFVGLWEEVVEWAKKPWNKLKNWVLNTLLPSLYKNLGLLLTIFVMFVAYNKLYETGSFAEVATGLWLFVCAGYFIFWKFFGAEKAFEKKRKKRK